MRGDNMPINLDTIHQETFDDYREFDIWLRGRFPNFVSLLMQDGDGYIKFWTKRKRWKSDYPYYRVAVIGEYGGYDSPLTEIYVVNILFTKEEGGGRDNMKVLTIYGKTNIKAAKHQLYLRRKEEARQKKWEEDRPKRERREEDRRKKELKGGYIRVYGKTEYNHYKDNEKTMIRHLQYNAQFDEKGDLLPEYK
jgi:hypothetical protein